MLTVRSSRRSQRGLSLVELMVGVTVGMFVAAAAAMLTGTQLASNRRLLTETQVQQDLRSTADIITREIRRAGYWNASSEWVWPIGTETPNPFQSINLPNEHQITFTYRRGSGQEGPYGFRWDSGTKSIQTLLAGSGWQDLTDPKAVEITTFSIAANSSPETKLPCAKLCADGTDGCWPRHSVRQYVVTIEGNATSDTAVKRALRTDVRVRNDYVRFADAANPTHICPK